MRRAARVAVYLTTGLVGLVLAAAILVYVLSERTLRRTYDAALTPFTAATDSADLSEGRRLAQIRGCYGGCHGRSFEGQLFLDEPGVVRISAPNLTQIVREYSDPELERVIRRGVKRDGRGVFAMPSPTFAELADEDLAKILGFLRSHPYIESGPPEFSVGPVGRIGLALGQVRSLAEEIRGRPPQRVPREDDVTWGRYLVRTSCTECHGYDLRGDPSGSPPDMAIGAAYSDDDWERLIRDGVGSGGRELPLMGEIARRRLSHFTDGEMRAVHTFLKAMAADSMLRR